MKDKEENDNSVFWEMVVAFCMGLVGGGIILTLF